MEPVCGVPGSSSPADAPPSVAAGQAAPRADEAGDAAPPGPQEPPAAANARQQQQQQPADMESDDPLAAAMASTRAPVPQQLHRQRGEPRPQEGERRHRRQSDQQARETPSPVCESNGSGAAAALAATTTGHGPPQQKGSTGSSGASQHPSPTMLLHDASSAAAASPESVMPAVAAAGAAAQAGISKQQEQLQRRLVPQTLQCSHPVATTSMVQQMIASLPPEQRNSYVQQLQEHMATNATRALTVAAGGSRSAAGGSYPHPQQQAGQPRQLARVQTQPPRLPWAPIAGGASAEQHIGRPGMGSPAIASPVHMQQHQPLHPGARAPDGSSCSAALSSGMFCSTQQQQSQLGGFPQGSGLGPPPGSLQQQFGGPPPGPPFYQQQPVQPYQQQQQVLPQRFLLPPPLQQQQPPPPGMFMAAPPTGTGVAQLSQQYYNLTQQQMALRAQLSSLEQQEHALRQQQPPASRPTGDPQLLAAWHSFTSEVDTPTGADALAQPPACLAAPLPLPSPVAPVLPGRGEPQQQPRPDQQRQHQQLEPNLVAPSSPAAASDSSGGGTTGSSCDGSTSQEVAQVVAEIVEVVVAMSVKGSTSSISGLAGGDAAAAVMALAEEELTSCGDEDTGTCIGMSWASLSTQQQHPKQQGAAAAVEAAAGGQAGSRQGVAALDSCSPMIPASRRQGSSSMGRCTGALADAVPALQHDQVRAPCAGPSRTSASSAAGGCQGQAGASCRSPATAAAAHHDAHQAVGSLMDMFADFDDVLAPGGMLLDDLLELDSPMQPHAPLAGRPSDQQASQQLRQHAVPPRLSFTAGGEPGGGRANQQQQQQPFAGSSQPGVGMHALVRHSHSPAHLAGPMQQSVQQSALMHQPRPGHPAWQALGRTTVTTAANQGFHHHSGHPHVVSTFQQGAQQQQQQLAGRHGLMPAHAGHGPPPGQQQQGPPSQLLSPRGPSPAEFASMHRQRFADPPFAQQQAPCTPGGWQYHSASPGLSATSGLHGSAEEGFDAQLMGDQHGAGGARHSVGGGGVISPMVDPAAAAAQPRGVLSMLPVQLPSHGLLPRQHQQLGQPPGGMQPGHGVVTGQQHGGSIMQQHPGSMPPQLRQPGPPYAPPQLPPQHGRSPFCSAQAQQAQFSSFGGGGSGPLSFQDPPGATFGQPPGPPQLGRAMSHHAGLGSSGSGSSGYVPHPGVGPPLHYGEQRMPPPLHRIGSAPLLSSSSGSMAPGGPGPYPYAPTPCVPESWPPPREHRAGGSPHPGALGPGHALPPHHAAAADAAAAAAASAPWGAGVAPVPERRPRGRPPKVMRLSVNPGGAADGSMGGGTPGLEPPGGPQASGSSGSGGGLQRKRSSTNSGMDVAVLKPVKSLKLERSGSLGSEKGGATLSTSSSGAPHGQQQQLPRKKASGMPHPFMRNGVLVPPPAGPEMTARGKPTFADLVQAGAFPPGTYEFSVGTVQSVTASVAANGIISYGSEQYQSISSFALAAARSRNPNRQACDGWKEVRMQGKKLELWRLAFLNKQPPPEVPPGCVRSTSAG